MGIRRCLGTAVALTLAAGTASAGAWPREEGSVFASATARLSWPQRLADWVSAEPTGRYDTLYVEYGLSARLTLGLDLGRSVSGDGKTVVFLRYPLRSAPRGVQVAAELGVGWIDGAPALHPGLSLGMGWARGWVAADALAELAPDEEQGPLTVDAKLDLTLGLNLTDRHKLLLQMQTGLPSSEPAFARLAPSLVWPLTERLSAEIGATWGLQGDSSMGVTLGLWAEF